jgi:ornithine decarboxylase
MEPRTAGGEHVTVVHRAGVDLDAMTENTPYLLMDLASIEAHFRDMTNAMPDVEVHFAMKSNPDIQVLRFLKGLGCEFEIASDVELRSLQMLSIDPATVLFSNPVKRPQDIAHAAQLGVWRFSVDSLEELDKVAKYAPGSAVYVRLATPARASKVSSEGKFGVDGRQAIQILKRARELGLRPYGLTFHVGSQMVDPGAWKPCISLCADIMRSLMPFGIWLEMLDIGGGFPVSYDVPVPSMKEFGEVINDALEQLPYAVKITSEPGRALVAESGVLVATVIGTAYRNGYKWVHLDVGAFNGMMESLETHNTLRYPVEDSLRQTEQVSCHLTGPSCDGQDTIMFDVNLSKDLACGDRVYIGNAGSYTTAYASSFNGFAIPSTIISN